MNAFRPYAKYVTAALAGLAAANGVLGLVPVPVVSEVLALASVLGLYLLPSPVPAPAPVPPPPGPVERRLLGRE